MLFNTKMLSFLGIGFLFLFLNSYGTYAQEQEPLPKSKDATPVPVVITTIAPTTNGSNLVDISLETITPAPSLPPTTSSNEGEVVMLPSAENNISNEAVNATGKNQNEISDSSTVNVLTANNTNQAANASAFVMNEKEKDSHATLVYMIIFIIMILLFLVIGVVAVAVWLCRRSVMITFQDANSELPTIALPPNASSTDETTKLIADGDKVSTVEFKHVNIAHPKAKKRSINTSGGADEADASTPLTEEQLLIDSTLNEVFELGPAATTKVATVNEEKNVSGSA